MQTAAILDSVHALLSTGYILDGSRLLFISKRMYQIIVMFMYSYCYVCSVLSIVFHCVILCIVCVYMCTVLLPPGVNPIAINKCIVSYHIFRTKLEGHVNMYIYLLVLPRQSLPYYYRNRRTSKNCVTVVTNVVTEKPSFYEYCYG